MRRGEGRGEVRRGRGGGEGKERWEGGRRGGVRGGPSPSLALSVQAMGRV